MSFSLSVLGSEPFSPASTPRPPLVTPTPILVLLEISLATARSATDEDRVAIISPRFCLIESFKSGESSLNCLSC